MTGALSTAGSSPASTEDSAAEGQVQVQVQGQGQGQVQGQGQAVCPETACLEAERDALLAEWTKGLAALAAVTEGGSGGLG